VGQIVASKRAFCAAASPLSDQRKPDNLPAAAVLGGETFRTWAERRGSCDEITLNRRIGYWSWGWMRHRRHNSMPHSPRWACPVD